MSNIPSNAQPVVIIPAEEHAHLVEQAAVLAQLVELAKIGNDSPRMLNAKETVAITFSAKFDPARADEWGHVSYCFSEALQMAICVAGQEARR